MEKIEFRQTNSIKFETGDNAVYKEKKVDFVKGHSANSSIERTYSDESKTSSIKDINEIKIAISKRNDILKRKILNMLRNESIVVGYTSMTEMYIAEMLEKDIYKTKDVLGVICYENFDNPRMLQKILEVMSNLDYEKLKPTNTLQAAVAINHVDVGVQEAAIASFEKWDDKENLNLLRNINYATPWIESYAKEVIEYLESC